MRLRDFLSLVVLAAIWGGSYLFMRIAAPEFGAVALVEVRVIVAALFLLPFLAMWRGFGALKSHFRPLLVNSVLILALPFLLITWAMLSLSAGFGAIVNSTAPFFAALVAYAWLGERLSGPRILGLLVGFGGVMLLVWDSTSMAAPDAGWAFAAALTAAFLYGLGTNYIRRHLSALDPLTVACGTQICAVLVVTPLAPFTLPAAPPSLQAWLSVIALGVIATGAAQVMYFRLVAVVGATGALAVTFLIPLFGMLWGALFLQEPVTANMIAGTAVIVLGTALTTGLIGGGPKKRSS